MPLTRASGKGHAEEPELELELIQPHMAQKPVLRGEVGCACVAREVSVERGGISIRCDTRHFLRHVLRHVLRKI